MIFNTFEQAKTQARAWRKLYPSAKFAIKQSALGNKVRWEVVQTNRFSNS